MFEFLLYLSIFTLGLYVNSQFANNHDIQPYRWIFTCTCIIIFRAVLFYLEKQKDRVVDSDTYHDAECHVFRSYDRETFSYGWQYFFTDTDGLSRQSIVYRLKSEAINAYLTRPAYERGLQVL